MKLISTGGVAPSGGVIRVWDLAMQDGHCVLLPHCLLLITHCLLLITHSV